MIIVIEGGDQAGKLTQSTMLEKALKKRKIKTKETNPNLIVDGEIKQLFMGYASVIRSQDWIAIEKINFHYCDYDDVFLVHIL